MREGNVKSRSFFSRSRSRASRDAEVPNTQEDRKQEDRKQEDRKQEDRKQEDRKQKTREPGKRSPARKMLSKVGSIIRHASVKSLMKKGNDLHQIKEITLRLENGNATEYISDVDETGGPIIPQVASAPKIAAEHETKDVHEANSVMQKLISKMRGLKSDANFISDERDDAESPAVIKAKSVDKETTEKANIVDGDERDTEMDTATSPEEIGETAEDQKTQVPAAEDLKSSASSASIKRASSKTAATQEPAAEALKTSASSASIKPASSKTAATQESAAEALKTSASSASIKPASSKIAAPVASKDEAPAQEGEIKEDALNVQGETQGTEAAKEAAPAEDLPLVPSESVRRMRQLENDLAELNTDFKVLAPDAQIDTSDDSEEDVATYVYKAVSYENKATAEKVAAEEVAATANIEPTPTNKEEEKPATPVSPSSFFGIFSSLGKPMFGRKKSQPVVLSETLVLDVNSELIQTASTTDTTFTVEGPHNYFDCMCGDGSKKVERMPSIADDDDIVANSMESEASQPTAVVVAATTPEPVPTSVEVVESPAVTVEEPPKTTTEN